MWFVRDENGKTHCVEDVETAADDFVRSVKHCYEIQKNVNARLREENQKLKHDLLSLNKVLLINQKLKER